MATMTDATGKCDTATATAAPMTHGRVWARLGFGVGIAASVAANVAHTFVPPATVVRAAHMAHAAVKWTPEAGAIVAAAFWPVALVISIEVISRVHWPNRWYWFAIRYIGMSAVAVISAVISYGHLSSLMRAYGEDTLSATIGPLAVDGLMAVCSGAMLAIGENVRQTRKQTPDLTPIRQPTPAATPTATAPSEPVRQDMPATATPVAPATPARIRPATPKRTRRGARSTGDTAKRDDARAQYRAGTPVSHIADALGVGRKTVQRWTQDLRDATQKTATSDSDNEHDPARDHGAGGTDTRRQQVTHPDDNRPPPKETTRGRHDNDQHRADAPTSPAEASGTGSPAGVGAEPTRDAGPQDTAREASDRQLPAPVLTR